jgi:hypothetical protein
VTHDSKKFAIANLGSVLTASLLFNQPIQTHFEQEATEEAEKLAILRSLRCLLFKMQLVPSSMQFYAAGQGASGRRGPSFVEPAKSL